ncbi:class I SAM-dependent methyltransferase [Flavobacterium sp.]|uniref:class I SAM-dependent methyltransferase n=1 Tax=Flavobacterium sp. TaxID=239 RepID=UPI00374CF627
MDTTTKNSFSGSIPFKYEEYLGPLLFESYAIDMAKRVKETSPSKILEIACGTGRVTNQLLNELPNAQITATDINPAMLNLAKDIVKNQKNVTWEVADAMSLPFDDEYFDCITAQFGVMFYQDKIKAHKEAFRVLKKGGTYIFNSWNKMEENHVIHLVKKLMEEYFPIDPPSFYNVPFSYFEPATITSDLEEGGFHDIKTSLVKVNGYSKDSHSAATGLLEGTPIYGSIIEKDEDILPEIINKLSGKLADLYGKENLSVPLQAIVTTAKKK